VDASNTVYLVWTDRRNGSDDDIYGAASNSGLWTNVAVVTGAGNQSSPAVAAEAAGSVLHFVWVDDTAGNRDIHYASSDAMSASPLTGMNIIDDNGGTDQTSPAITTVGSMGDGLAVLVCWRDSRNLDTDLYFVEVRDGTETNIFVGDDGTNANQSEPAIGVDIYGHPYLVWTDARASSAIYYTGSTFFYPTPLQSADVNASVGATVGPEIVNDLGDVSVIIPPGALPCDLRITISQIGDPPEVGTPLLASYEFGPSGIEFLIPVTITIPYAAPAGGVGAATPTPYWYNSLTATMSQQGITDIQEHEISPGLRALSFKTTHLTSFHVLLRAAPDGGGGGGGGGGCSICPSGDGSILEFLLPYLGLAAVLLVPRLRDQRRRQVIGRKPQG
jgi:hypothetical protein